MAKDIEGLRLEIQNMQQTLKTATHYELLDVSRELNDADLRKEVAVKFRNLARQWHVDRYHSLQLGEERQQILDIFQAVNNANQILSDPKRRADYDAELRGDTTDISAIINAESAFRRGQTMLEQGSYRGAHAQFESAFNLNPKDDEYRAHYLYTEYLEITKNEEGVPLDRKRALEIYTDLDEISKTLNEKDWLLVFLAVVSLGLGRDTEAENLLRNALMINAKNHQAQRHIRIIEMRKARSKKGFFGGLMERLKGSK